MTLGPVGECEMVRFMVRSVCQLGTKCLDVSLAVSAPFPTRLQGPGDVWFRAGPRHGWSQNGPIRSEHFWSGERNRKTCGQNVSFPGLPGAAISGLAWKLLCST